MSELDLEAIKARVGERVINIDQTAIDNATGVDLAMVVEIWRLHKRLTVTDDMVERAAKEYAAHIIVDNWDYLTDLTREAFRADARRILEAALGEGDA